MASDPRPFKRRAFLKAATVAPLALAGEAHAAPSGLAASQFPHTVEALRGAFQIETAAHLNYVPFARRAVAESLPNIAYLFQAFSISEKQHADNYQVVLGKLGVDIVPAEVKVVVGTTRENLRLAAQRELDKIKQVYPSLLQALEGEHCDEAIVNAMYSMKSHQQHEEQVTQIERYAGMFFSAVADDIEARKLDFHICRVCGSTINSAPTGPCVICNRSRRNYVRVERPKAAS